jgi:hypothetical protein
MSLQRTRARSLANTLVVAVMAAVQVRARIVISSSIVVIVIVIVEEQYGGQGGVGVVSKGTKWGGSKWGQHVCGQGSQSGAGQLGAIWGPCDGFACQG